MATTKRAINEYLFYEFGRDLDSDPGRIADDWPYTLVEAGAFGVDERRTQVLAFTDAGDRYFALNGPALTYCSVAGMAVADLRLQALGGAWIGRQEPIDLATTRLGGEMVPPVLERRAAIEALAAQVLPGQPAARVLEGLYLRRTHLYLALVQDARSNDAFIVGTSIEPRLVPFPEASPSRRLSWSVGRLIDQGRLPT